MITQSGLLRGQERPGKTKKKKTKVGKKIGVFEKSQEKS